jgi:processive 1,2-diacylglycerol beta-glucosyltransferase
MDQWMAASDLLAGKAGGLTVSEALASGLPMAIVGSLAGPQEERNADILLERGAAIRCNNLPTAGWKIGQVMDDPARLARMRAAARAMARPRAAVEIAADCIQLLQAAGGVEKS